MGRCPIGRCAILENLFFEGWLREKLLVGEGVFGGTGRRV